MTRTPFEQAMEGFRAELVDLVKQRNSIETRINKVSTAMEAMARTCEDFEKAHEYLDDIRSLTSRIGFQDAIRSLLGLNASGLTAIEIRDLIVRNNWMDLSQYSNPLASIYTTLRRMKETETIEEIEKGGDKAFRLKHHPPTRKARALQILAEGRKQRELKDLK